jgi:sulfur-oxidizing protein SoxX
MRRTGAARLLSALLLLGGALGGAAPGSAIEPVASEVIGDAIPRSLTGTPGDAARGREIALSRERGNCAICHVIPAPDAVTHGDAGPSLAAVADRLSEGQIRLRLVDGRRLNPTSLMPSYHRVEGLKRVAAAYAGKPVLTAQEIEDVVAFLMTLRKEAGKR